MQHTTSSKKITLLALLLSLLQIFPCLVSHTDVQAESPHTPKRIVVLPLFAEEILLDMIGPERIVGISHAFYPSGENYSPTMNLTKAIKGDLSIDDTEGILAVDPDLVVLYKANFHHYETLLPALEQAGISILFVEEPEGFDDVVEAMELLGNTVGAMEKASQMIVSFENSLAQLQEAVSSIPDEKRMYATHYSLNEIAFYDEIARAAGVINAGGAEGSAVTIEQLAAWNPGLITVDTVAYDTDGSVNNLSNDYTERFIQTLLETPDIFDVEAVKKQRIYPLSSHASHYMVQSAIELAQLAYPDLF